MRVLIVDDSAVYRTKIRAALSGLPWIEVVGVASNGKIALEMLSQKDVDLLILDMEMPIMDGLETLKELRKRNLATKVIVFSSTTVRGAEITMDALHAGASDFVTKPVMSITDTVLPEDLIRKELVPKIEQFFLKKNGEKPPANPVKSSPVVVGERGPKKDLDTFIPSIIVIASSTGGPSAHEDLFSGMGGQLRCPIVIAQHMPPVFTASFAKRIADYSGLPCKEATNGEKLKNEIYVAPGDYHLSLKNDAQYQVFTALDKLAPRNSVRPAADPLFETAAQIYGAKCMSFVLTGMGEDGLVGVRAIKSKNGGVMIQSAESCVVFGMPAAIMAAGLQDDVGSIGDIRKRVKRMALL